MKMSVWNKGAANSFPMESCSQMLVSGKKESTPSSYFLFLHACPRQRREKNELITPNEKPGSHLCRSSHGNPTERLSSSLDLLPSRSWPAPEEFRPLHLLL